MGFHLANWLGKTIEPCGDDPSPLNVSMPPGSYLQFGPVHNDSTKHLGGFFLVLPSPLNVYKMPPRPLQFVPGLFSTPYSLCVLIRMYKMTPKYLFTMTQQKNPNLVGRVCSGWGPCWSVWQVRPVYDWGQLRTVSPLSVGSTKMRSPINWNIII